MANKVKEKENVKAILKEESEDVHTDRKQYQERVQNIREKKLQQLR